MAQIDIIIVNYNSTDYLLRCLRSIYRESGDIAVNIFVADNGSEDGVDRLLDQFQDINLLKNEQNLGFAAAVNQCLRKCSSQYLLLLNPDTAINRGFFKPLIQYMEMNPKVGVLGPKIYDHDLKVQGSARSFPTPFTALFGRNTILTRCFPNNRLSRKNILNLDCDNKTPINVDWLSGACMLVRREAIDEVGLLDSHFFMYWEDADWCIRFKNAGWDIVYFPGAAVVHLVGGSSEHNLTRSIFEFHKSAYYLFNKYYQSPFGICKPLVIMALSIRICFAFSINSLRRWHDKNKECRAADIFKEAVQD